MHTYPLAWRLYGKRPEIIFFFLSQDGRIDYGEFVAMMQKGIVGRTMRKSINMSLRNNAVSQ